MPSEFGKNSSGDDIAPLEYGKALRRYQEESRASFQFMEQMG